MKRRIWTAEAVETLWTIMAARKGQRKRGQIEVWWGSVALDLSRALGVTLTGKACLNKASEVRMAGRKLPWELKGDPVAAAASVLKTAAPDRFAQIEAQLATVIRLLEDRLAPSPDVIPGVNQLWTTQTRAVDDKRLNMRIIDVTENSVTLAEIGVVAGGMTYTIPKTRLLSDYVFVGLARQTPEATPVVPVRVHDLGALLR